MNRFAKITALAAISAISLTACGANGDKGSSSASSSKTTSTASSAAQPSDSSADAVSFKPACPGGSISGAGSSAQLNAINQVIRLQGCLFLSNRQLLPHRLRRWREVLHR